MRHAGFTVVITALVLAACQQPPDVELTHEGTETSLEVLPIVVPDTNLSLQSVDSLAVLPEDQLRFGGQLLINNVTLDGGQGRSSFVYARVFFADSVISMVGRMVGYHGMDLGTVALNGIAMIKVPHRIGVRRSFGHDTLVVRGVEYLADLSSSYQPNHQYVWTIAGGPLGTVTQSVESPGELMVVSPTGGAVIPRNKDLLLQWAGGNGRLAIVISTVDPLTRRTKPLIELRPRANTGRALLPAKLLQQLPAQHRFYAFTFILANRKDSVVVQQYAGRIIAQAAAVYTSTIELR